MRNEFNLIFHFTYSLQYNSYNNHYNCDTIDYIKDNNADSVNGTAIHKDNNDFNSSATTDNNDINSSATTDNNVNVFVNNNDERSVWSDRRIIVSKSGGEQGRYGRNDLQLEPRNRLRVQLHRKGNNRIEWP